MSRATERADAFLDRSGRRRRTLVSPEGVPLEIQVAGVMERFGAFALDLFLMLLIILAVVILFALLGSGSEVLGTLALFACFVVRNCYFIHFELAWQGRTPGKKACDLRVINRNGGELTPSAVIARNLTREVEFFLPLSLIFSLSPDGTVWRQLTLLGWVTVIATLPLWNSGRLRAGDLIAGTQVIAMPKRQLRMDLSTDAKVNTAAYTFTHQQLSLYGTFELQILEDLLRRPVTSEVDKVLTDVCDRICRKIGWDGGKIPQGSVRRFLTDFYSAERGELERGQLFGRVKTDKSDTKN